MTLNVDLHSLPASIQEFIQNGRWEQDEIVITDHSKPVAVLRQPLKEPWQSMIRLADKQPLRATMEEIQAWKEEGRE